MIAGLQMNSRQYLSTNFLMPTDLVTMTCEILPRLSLIDLERILIFTEMEIQYRQETYHD